MGEPQLNAVKPPDIEEILYFRGDSTDYDTFKYVFYEKEYRLSTLTFKPEWIIDGGANVGYTSVYFAEQFPDAKIVAVESELLM
ncbi:hypothetical protein ACJROX_29700 [Pseudalkalibacillus sp. A8]|uniref:hypothetical protein n=1 Tax=Pseudalkalibacillus sp. A8 TaxID=3382641 RepID=UPI0038B58886